MIENWTLARTKRQFVDYLFMLADCDLLPCPSEKRRIGDGIEARSAGWVEKPLRNREHWAATTNSGITSTYVRPTIVWQYLLKVGARWACTQTSVFFEHPEHAALFMDIEWFKFHAYAVVDQSSKLSITPAYNTDSRRDAVEHQLRRGGELWRNDGA